MTIKKIDRIRGAVYGLLVGDALGVPYEFSRPAEVPKADLIEMTPPLGFDRAHRGTPAGTWSDDGAQALLLLESLIEHPELELEHFGRGLLTWFEKGYMTPDGRVFDVGMQTRIGLAELGRGKPAHDCGLREVSDNGNGALMRVMPCALLPAQNRAELVSRARRQGLPTHGHLRSQLVCALYTLIADNLVKGHSPTISDALWQAIIDLTELTPAHEQSELTYVLDGQLEPSQGSGYVLDSFWSAVRCVQSTDSYEACVRAAIALGRDTDTTACIAGGLAGALYGEQAIPQRWRDTLKGKDIVEGLLVRIPQ